MGHAWLPFAAPQRPLKAGVVDGEGDAGLGVGVGVMDLVGVAVLVEVVEGEGVAEGVLHLPYAAWQPVPHQASPVPQYPYREQHSPLSQTLFPLAGPHILS